MDPRESKSDKWNQTKQTQWGERCEQIDNRYKTPHDYFMGNFLRIDLDYGMGLGYALCDLEYDRETKKFGVGIVKADQVITACEVYSSIYSSKDMQFKINGEINVPADTQSEWNQKHYVEGLERLDNTIAYYSLDRHNDSDEDELDENNAKIRRIEEIKGVVEAVFQTACNSGNNGLEKNMAGIIDVNIARYINTLQGIINNNEISEDEKIVEIQKRLDKISQMKEAELYILGIRGMLNEDEA